MLFVRLLLKQSEILSAFEKLPVYIPIMKGEVQQIYCTVFEVRTRSPQPTYTTHICRKVITQVDLVHSGLHHHGPTLWVCDDVTLLFSPPWWAHTHQGIREAGHSSFGHSWELLGRKYESSLSQLCVHVRSSWVSLRRIYK